MAFQAFQAFLIILFVLKYLYLQFLVIYGLFDKNMLQYGLSALNGYQNHHYLKGNNIMTLTNDDIMAISDILDHKLEPINQRLDAMDQRLDAMDCRFDRIESRLNVIEFKQDRMAEQLKEIDGRQKLFEVNANKRITRLQDGMDTIVEILRLNHLIPV